MRQFSSALAFLLVLMSSTAFAGGAPAASGPKFDWKTSEGLQSVANQFVQAIVDGQYEAAYQMGGETLLGRAFLSIERLHLMRKSEVCKFFQGLRLPLIK